MPPPVFGMDQALFDQVTRVVKLVLRQERGNVPSVGYRNNQRPLRWAIITSNTDAPTDGVASPASVPIKLLKVDENDTLIIDGDATTMEHRWEAVDFEKDQLCLVTRVGSGRGKWVPVCLSCGPLDSPPS